MPVIVGVANATLELRMGEVVTLDVQEGVVHRGPQTTHPSAVPSFL